MQRVAIIDFETTGMYPDSDRIIEVAVALVENGEVIDTFDQLMDPGFRVPSFIASLTGISTEMVRGQPSPEEVMPQLRAFVGDCPCLAHNASFDRRFFEHEMQRADQAHTRPWLCSVLLSRRLIIDAPNNKLGTLFSHLGLSLPAGMRAHRALADVLMTVELWKHLHQEIRIALRGKIPDLRFLEKLQKTPKAKVESLLATKALEENSLI